MCTPLLGILEIFLKIFINFENSWIIEGLSDN